MLTQLQRRPSSPSIAARAVTVLAIFSALAAVAACDQMPLVAPSGTVITLYPNSTVLAPNGSIEITAVAIEAGTAPTTGTDGTTGGTATPAAGTPVHNGTLISFTTTLGRVDPQEARTHNGQVTVRLFADGKSGVATIRAFSGGASSNELKINVGTAAAKTVFLTSTPQTLNSSGGTAQINARVVDESGSNLSGVPVTFTADNGTLSQSVVSTNDSGIAATQLTTSRQTVVKATVGADVTAEVTVRLNPRIGITITPPTTEVAAGQPALFTVAVGADANVQSVRVTWGDGSSTNLGALTGSTTVAHTYRNSGTYSVTASATDASGETAQQSTSVTILPQQPPGVIITPSDTTPNVGQVITLTATVSGATSTILEYRWDFGDGRTATTTGNQTTVSYPATGTKTITVTVIQASGPNGQGQTQVVVEP
jgi:hypothetical protein